MTRNNLSSELLLKTILNFFDHDEIEQIAQHIVRRLDKEVLTMLNEDAQKNNMDDG